MLDEAVLKSGPVVDPTTHLGRDTRQTHEYILAMHNYASLRGKELSKYLDTSKSKKLLDLGCGPGTYSFQLGIKNPDLQIHLLDLPNILEITKEVQKRYPVKNKIYYLPLDVTKEEIPGSYDMILVSNILHMLGESENRRLIKRLYQSVNLHGSLVIQAQYLQDNRLGGRWPIFLDLIQLCTTTLGKNHSVNDFICFSCNSSGN